MTTDTGTSTLTLSGQGDPASTPKYITEAEMQRHIAALQSAKDREIAEERALTDEYATRLREMESRIEQAEARTLDGEDPRYVELVNKARAAEKKARDATSLVQRFAPAYKDAIVKLSAYELAPGDATRRVEIEKALAVGRTEAEVRQLAAQLRATGATPTPAPTTTPAPPARERDEIDAGRGSGRAGAVRITREFLAEVGRTPGMYTQHKDAIEAAMAKGVQNIPDR